jgi:predicted DNA-binding protein with PD1-like motif
MKFNKQIDDDIINAIVTLTTGKEFITELRDIATKEQIPFESIVRRAHSLRNNQIINNNFVILNDL